MAYDVEKNSSSEIDSLMKRTENSRYLVLISYWHRQFIYFNGTLFDIYYFHISPDVIN